MDLIPYRQLYGMNLYLDMLLIFQNWHKQLFPYKYALAQAGFYYAGQSDITLCVSLAILRSVSERRFTNLVTSISVLASTT